MTIANMPGRCTACGHGKAGHEALDPQCSAARCTCLRYRPAAPAGVPAPAPPARPLAVVAQPTAQPTPQARVPLTVDDLVRACQRSELKRTQGLGRKLAELAERTTAALRAERETAEEKAKRSAELAAAQAEVKRLTRALAEAKAKATGLGQVGGARGGARECSECGAQFPNGQALGAHKRHKHGIPGKSHQQSAVSHA